MTVWQNLKGDRPMNDEKRGKKLRATVFFALFVVFFLFAAYFVGEPMVKFLGEPEKFREWVGEKGILAPIVFVLMVIFQVVIAIVPGEPFEIAAGYAFGYFGGTALFMLGAMIGSALIFFFVRRFGQGLCYLFFSREKIQRLGFLKDTKRNKALFFLIFMIPGTPKDLLSYFAGLSDMSFGWWMFVASVGRIPSLITSVIGGGAMGEGEYKIAIISFIVAAIVSVAGYFVYSAIMKKQERKEEKEGKDELQG